MKLRGRFGAAAAVLAAALMLSCGNEKAREAGKLVEKAQALLASHGGNRKDALQKCRVLLKKALALDPGRDEAESLLARVLLEQGEFARALETLGGIPFPAPRDSLTAALAAARLYQLKGDASLADRALIGLQEAGSLAGPEAKFAVARALLEGPGEAGRRKGLDLLEKLLREVKDPPSRWEAYLGVALFRAGRKKDALSHLEKALKDPDLPDRETLRKLADACR